MDRAEEIRRFWFDGLDDSGMVDAKKPPASRWFRADRQFDDEIRRRFEQDLKKARAGRYKDWQASPAGALALILLFDQFPRNIYRNTPAMYEDDARALKIVLEGLKDKSDRKLPLIERVFFYMPLQHAEDLQIQELSVRCFETLVSDSRGISPQNTGYFEYNLVYARRHHEIIERFGRFPHRNRILGRAATPEESEFLKEKNSSF